MSDVSLFGAQRGATRWILLTLLSLAVLVSCVAVLRKGGLPIVPDNYDSVPSWVLFVFALSYFLVLVVRALRWHFQLKPIAQVPLLRVVSACWLGIIGIIALPFRSGELVRPALLARSGNVPFVAVLTTTLSERLVDALYAALLLVGCLSLTPIQEPLPDHIGALQVPVKWVLTLGYSVGLATLAAVTVALVFYAFRVRAIALLQRLGETFSVRLGNALAARLNEVAGGLEFVSKPRELIVYLALTAAYWGIHLLGLLFLLRQCGFEECTVAQAGVLLGTLMFGASVPNSPGLFGVFQVATYAALALYWPAERLLVHGSVAAFWIYVLEIGGTVALTPIAWLMYVSSGETQTSGKRSAG